MLTSATVENFRGIERLQVEGLGRVNLIIGRNDSGKTALMEALELLWVPEDAGFVMVARQSARHPEAKMVDFDDFWLPIFRRMDAARGFSVEGTDKRGEHVKLTMNKSPLPPMEFPVDTGDSQTARKAWELEWRITRQETETRSISSNGTSLQFPAQLTPSEGRFWIAPSPSITALDIRALSKLKQQGRGDSVIGLLRLINDRVTGIELLAPSGERAVVFVQLEHEGLLPLSMMGEGAKRSFELAVALSSQEHPVLCIDEVENGLHHSTMGSLWSWIAEVSLVRGAQIFATTHSEECVQAACRAFGERGDEGLRVIRLDKQERETKAVVYDRNLVEAAARMGVEIRG
ncbi:ATP-binding protein [Myxococcus sp. CA033]|uniref:AAA family ATPase n=1 Tax=Myxococcus sp. CA033 TaxID=2741516 RepID=UPI00157B87BF|nr:ATP-binding protein [Myxococcus sp. CA033]NTX40798.1 ATP-binding protein [Myxococcus sp. CA033]